MTEIKYLGLDISTSIIGICFLDSNYNLVDLQAINLKKIKCMFQKSLIVKNEFSKIKYNYNISENLEISIEEAFQPFSKGFSSAKTFIFNEPVKSAHNATTLSLDLPNSVRPSPKPDLVSLSP